MPASLTLLAPMPEVQPAGPHEQQLVVSRSAAPLDHGTCALCWRGPEHLAGRIHPRGAPLHDPASRAICSRCLVTLEMLAMQFDSHLRLEIETSA